MSSIIFLLVQTFVFFYVTFIIDPATIGIYSLSIASILIGIGIIENSFVSSLIHSNTSDPQDYNAVLTINNSIAVLFSFILTLLCLVLFVTTTQLLYITAVLFLLPCLFLSAYNKTQLTGLQNNLNFKEIAAIEFWSSLIYITSLFISSALNLGIWILLIAFFTKYLSTFLIIKIKALQITTQYFNYKNDKITHHWDYGKYIGGEKIITAFITYADTFIVTFTLGLSTLGIYEIFKRIVIRPITVLYAAVENLFFPLMAKYKNDDVGFQNIYGQLIYFSKYIFINITCILYVQSELLLSFLPIAYQQVEVLKAICIFAGIVIIVNPIDIILYSRGQSKRFFIWILSYSLPLIGVILFSSTIGLTSMIYAISVFYILLYILSYFVLIKENYALTFLKYHSVLVYTFLLFASVYLIISLFDNNLYSKMIISLILVISTISKVLLKKN